MITIIRDGRGDFMKMFKRICASLLVVSILVTFAGCTDMSEEDKERIQQVKEGVAAGLDILSDAAEGLSDALTTSSTAELP